MKHPGFLVLTILALLAPSLEAQSGSTGSVEAPEVLPSVFIDADPLGCRIVLDGVLRPERTPALLRGLTPGHHTVILGREGYRRAEVSFELSTSAETASVEADLVPDAAVLAFPAASEVRGPEGPVATEGRQFRYPAGSYRVEVLDGAVALTPVFPEEGSLAVASWSLALVSAAALVSTAGDVWALKTGRADHPSFVTLGLWTAALVDLPWWGQLSGQKARFLRRAQPDAADLAGRLDEAKPLFLQGEAALEAGDLDRAAGAFGRLVREQPQSRYLPQAWFRLARIHSMTGHRDLARGEYLLVADTYPQAETHDRARQALADLLEAAGDPVGALAQLDAMVFNDGYFTPDDVADQKARLQAAAGEPHAP